MTWLAASMVVLGLALALGFAWWERSHPPSRLVALVATMAGLAVLGRFAFAPLPNVKPTTDLVLFAGFALGGAPGFVVGAVTALVSNLYFGQGPWTPWQMVAWGGVGLLGAALAAFTRGRTPSRTTLALTCGFAGLGFGAVMNLSMWVTYGGDHSVARLAAYQATSAPFDVAHVLGNVAFCLAFGPALIASLTRFKARLEVDWTPVAPRVPAPAAAGAAGGAVAAVLAAVVLAGGLAAAPDAQAAAGARLTAYLERAQNADGGFGAAPGQGSGGLYTGWTALGLAAAGRNPLDVSSSGRSVVDYLRADVRQVSDLGEIDRTILVLVAAGRDPRAFGGRDLVREVLDGQARNGSFAGRVNTTAFAVLALRAAGRSPSSRTIRRGADWIAGQVNPDGGFNFAGKGGQSGVDDTSAALQALASAGRPVKRAARFLTANQNADGGFPLTPGAASNAQSTAWAVQGLVAAHRDPDAVRTGGSRSPIAYLRSLTADGGAVRYSHTSTQTPVWVTGQALTALARKPFPLARVPRARRAAAVAARAPEATAAPTATPAKPRRTPTPAPTADASTPAAPGEAAIAALAHRAGLLAGTASAVLG